MQKKYLFILAVIAIIATALLIKPISSYLAYISMTKQVDYRVVAISPKHDKFLATKDGYYLILDAQSEKVLLKEKVNFFGPDISDCKWINDHELVFEIFDGQNNEFYLTRDLKHFTLIYKKSYEIITEFIRSSPNYQKFAYQNKTKEWIIDYRTKDSWNTGLIFKITGYSWSNDGRYLKLSNDKIQYLLDTKLKKVIKLDKKFSGEWAPSKNLYAFFAERHSLGFSENGFYIFNPDKLIYNRINTPGPSFDHTESWSPNSQYYAVDYGKYVYIVNLKKPNLPPQKIISFDNHTSVSGELFWSTDSQNLLFLTRTTAYNIFKPADYHVVKVNLKTGKVKKFYIQGMVNSSFWMDSNILYYTLDHTEGLFRLKLNW